MGEDEHICTLKIIKNMLYSFTEDPEECGNVADHKSVLCAVHISAFKLLCMKGMRKTKRFYVPA